MAKQRGNPIITLRLPGPVIAALKISAQQHGETVSGLIRDLIDDQLRRDGIQPTSKPIDGQISM